MQSESFRRSLLVIYDPKARQRTTIFCGGFRNVKDPGEWYGQVQEQMAQFGSDVAINFAGNIRVYLLSKSEVRGLDIESTEKARHFGAKLLQDVTPSFHDPLPNRKIEGIRIPESRHVPQLLWLI